MDKELKRVIENSTFTVKEGRFVYVKAASLPQSGEHFMVARDEDEITVVTRAENLPGIDLVERNKDFYKLIALNVSIPFYVGFLGVVSKGISEAGMNILIVSTYSKDYIMVKNDCEKKAKEALLSLGFKENKD